MRSGLRETRLTVRRRCLAAPLAEHEHGGFCLLRASDVPLPPRAEPAPGADPRELAPGDELDMRDVAFLKGWHQAEPAGRGWIRPDRRHIP